MSFDRLTVSTLACPNWPLRTIVESCARAGVTGIDFRGVLGTIDHTLLPAFGSESPATRELLARHKLSIPCMCSSVKLMTVEEHAWQLSLDEYRRYLKVADAFGSRFIRIFPGQSPTSMSRDAAVELARGRARELRDLAKSANAKPLLETHDDWGASAQVIRLLVDCEPDDFGVIWDVRHTWAAGEMPEAVITTLGRRLKHVHVKDSVIMNGKEQPALLGEGVVTVGPALKALAAARFDGWICLETEKRWHPVAAPEPEVSVPQFVEFVRAIA